jgi:hypothetical protein
MTIVNESEETLATIVARKSGEDWERIDEDFYKLSSAFEYRLQGYPLLNDVEFRSSEGALLLTVQVTGDSSADLAAFVIDAAIDKLISG